METETERPRDEAGQFTPSTENKFGRDFELANAGYIPAEDPKPAEEPTFASSEAGLREAADQLAESREGATEFTDEISLLNGDGSATPERVALTPEQASDRLSAYHGNVSRYVDGADLAGLTAEVDAARAAALEADPKSANELGLDPAEVAKNLKDLQTGEYAHPIDGEANLAEVEQSPKVDGLDPEVEKALSHPQVRQAIEERVAVAEMQRAGYEQALSQAQAISRAAITQIAPELSQVPPERWAEAIGIIAQTEPNKAQALVAALEQGARAEQAQFDMAQQRHAQQRVNFEASVRDADAQFEKHVGGREAAAKAYGEMFSYAESVGVTRQALAQGIWSNPALATFEFRQIWHDASRYHAAMANPPKPTPKMVPVQRPGVAAPRGARAAASLAALDKRLSSSGRIQDAMALLYAQRNGG